MVVRDRCCVLRKLVSLEFEGEGGVVCGVFLSFVRRSVTRQQDLELLPPSSCLELEKYLCALCSSFRTEEGKKEKGSPSPQNNSKQQREDTWGKCAVRASAV